MMIGHVWANETSTPAAAMSIEFVDNRVINRTLDLFCLERVVGLCQVVSVIGT